MISRLTLSLTAAVLALATVSPPALAQEETTFEPATLILTVAGEEEREYTVGDASFYVSTSAGYEDVPASVDLSVSLSTISPLDAELLEWSSQTSGKNKGDTRSIVIVGSATEGGEEMRYELTDAQVTSLSLMHSTYAAPSVSLSLSAGTLVVNGVAIN